MKRKDNEDQAVIRFQFGLILVLLMVYLGFEWKTYTPAMKLEPLPDLQALMDEAVPVTRHQLPKPPPPAAPLVIEVAPDDREVTETVITSYESNQESEILDAGDIRIEELPVDDEIPFVAVEEVPVFPGCEEASDMRACFNEMMQKHIRRNFRYPENAIDLGVQGRVSVMFTIQKDGSIGNIRLRGPDKSLEAEARRIIERLPRMTPGKQQGRVVQVPFSIPILFRLDQ